MPNFVCIRCTTDEKAVSFGSLAELSAHNKSVHEGKPLNINPKKVVDKPKPKPDFMPKPEPEREPIKLTYKFTGQCKDCGSVVDTLEMDVAKKHFASAFCIQCKKQLEVKEVVKL